MGGYIPYITPARKPKPVLMNAALSPKAGDYKRKVQAIHANG
jgi:hypothetical protein